jgi:hypothetical protein
MVEDRMLQHAINRTRRTEQHGTGRGNNLRRQSSYTPAAPGIPAICPFRVPGEERDGFPLQAEFILPEQFFSKLRVHETGERLLLAAVLEDAISCFQRFLFASRQRHQRLFQEAERWIMEETEETPREEREDMCPYFSFERVCDVLELDADGVRERLALWRERQLASAQSAVAAAKRSPRREGSRPAMPVGRSKGKRSQAA